jgi:signal transduction histidine kinase
MENPHARRLIAIPRPKLGDAVLAVLLSVPVVGGLAVVERGQRLVVLVPLALAQTLPLAWRRLRPLAVLAITVAATVALFAAVRSYDPVGAIVALYTVAGHCERPVAIRAGVATLLALVVPTSVVGDLGPESIIPNTILLALVWTVGAYLGELRARTRRAERDREAEARRAVAEEQARIARELHDVLAHNVSVMVVQAAAARDVFDASPERAREALATIEGTGRQALDELRRLLGAASGDGGPPAPQPGLARLDALADQVRAAGLAVELRVEGEPFPLPSGADLSAYRIVQEALTNTLKHARASKATVLVRYGNGGVELEVRDDGRGPAAPSGAGVTGGRGIIGMRERVALYGGSLDAGPAPGGGFAVTARFPIGAR